MFVIGFLAPTGLIIQGKVRSRQPTESDHICICATINPLTKLPLFRDIEAHAFSPL